MASVSSPRIRHTRQAHSVLHCLTAKTCPTHPAWLHQRIERDSERVIHDSLFYGSYTVAMVVTGGIEEQRVWARLLLSYTPDSHNHHPRATVSYICLYSRCVYPSTPTLFCPTTTLTMPNPISTHGFTAVPASATTLLTSTPAYPAPTSPPSPIPVTSTPIPNTPLAQRINSYAKTRLPEPTYHYSLRVYHYGLAIKQYRFAAHADWQFSDETYFLACVLHDIGTTEENITATHLSFEFFGGMLAMDVLRNTSIHNPGGDGPGGAPAGVASRDQAESVVEAIIRHQDLCEVGKITALGQLLQLATIFGKDFVFPHLRSSAV